MAEKIRVVMCPVDRPPYVTNITNSLSAMQSAVGGYIETVTRSDYVIVVNEEGLLRNLPINPSVPRYVGDLFFVGYKGDEFTDLDQGLARNILQMCKETYGKGNDKAAVSG